MTLANWQHNHKLFKKLTGRSAITWLIALQAAAVAPVCMAFMDTSTRKKYTAGIGSRTWIIKAES